MISFHSLRDGGKKLRRAFGWAIAVLALFYIFKHLWGVWPQLGGIHLRLAPALLALLWNCLGLLTYPLLWRNVLRRLGEELELRAAVRIWFVSQLARYVPGNIWHLLGRTYLARQEGVYARTVGMSLALELFQSITAALLVTVVSWPLWPQKDNSVLWVLLLIPLSAVYLWPNLLHRLLAWALRRFGQASLLPSLRRADLFALLPGYCATWLFYGCGLYFLAQAIIPLPLAKLPAFTGSFAIAWTVGFLSFITPSGLGVREGVLGYLLGFLMPEPEALLLVLLSRIWLTVAELLCTALAVWIDKVSQKGQ